MFVFIAQWDNFSDFLPWIMLNKTVICSRKNWSIRFLNVCLFVLETRMIISCNIFNVPISIAFFISFFLPCITPNAIKSRLHPTCLLYVQIIFLKLVLKICYQLVKGIIMAMNKKEINLLFTKNVWFKLCKLSLFAFNESMKINSRMQSKSWIEKKCEFYHRHKTFTDYVQYISWIIKKVRFWL